jgi:hypothetical protein
MLVCLFCLLIIEVDQIVHGANSWAYLKVTGLIVIGIFMLYHLFQLNKKRQ